MTNLARADILNLAVAERIQLVEDIWDSIAQVPEAVQLSDAQKDELERRLTAYHEDPQSASPWAVVRERILGC